MIHVMSYNLHSGRGTDRKRDYKRIGKFLRELKPHIVLLQEVDSRAKTVTTEQMILDLKSDHFPYFTAAPTMSTDSGWFGNALLSRFPIKQATIIDISVPLREPRNILEAIVQTPEGPLHILNTHKGLRAMERRSQISKLHEILLRESQIPLIVAGDINEWSSSSKALETLNKTLHPLEVGSSFPTRYPLFQLDRAWCRPKALVKKSEVLRTKETRVYSDHYPLWLEAKL